MKFGILSSPLNTLTEFSTCFLKDWFANVHSFVYSFIYLSCAFVIALLLLCIIHIRGNSHGRYLVNSSSIFPAALLSFYYFLLTFTFCLLPLSPRYLALYAYKPQKADELELRKGEMYRVTEKCQDGWFKGTSLRTAASGVFPGNYVTPVSRSVSLGLVMGEVGGYCGDTASQCCHPSIQIVMVMTLEGQYSISCAQDGKVPDLLSKCSSAA